ncbi:putative uncharacterized protein [Clostridium sp. CAG:288]|nr:putative uncharacterized protein [Clostridium sp. CAG:288]
MKAFIKFINTLGNIIILNILFVLTSVLSIGLCIGTSLSALYATFLDLKTDESGYYVRNYFKHFKGNFKSTIFIDIALILLAGAAYLNYLAINTINSSNVKLILYAVELLIGLEISFIASFYFMVVAKFEGKFTSLLYLSFIFAHKYLYLSILFVVLFIGSFFLLIYVSFAFIFIIFGLIAYIESLILKYIWRNYNYEISEL